MTEDAASGRFGQPLRNPANGFESHAAGSLECAAERKSPICLVVEDDGTMRHLVTNYLEDHDIRAVSASRRDEVAGLLARSQPDLVILNLRLGQEDGLDLLREIRAQSDIPIIITTGHRRDEIDRVVGLELGADDYITKPFGCGNCWRASARCCDGARPARPRPSATARRAAADSATGCWTGATGASPIPAASRSH